MALYAGVHILDAPYAVDRIYDYRIPAAMAGAVNRGAIVLVPFGKGNKRTYACVTEVRDTTTATRLKSVLSALPSRYSLDGELCDLSLFLASHTLCTVGAAVHTLLPPAVFSGIHETFSVPSGILFPRGEESFFSLLSSKESWTDKEIIEAFGEVGMKKMRRFTEDGLIAGTALPDPPRNIRKKKIYALSDTGLAYTENRLPLLLRSKKQKDCLFFLKECGSADKDTLSENAGVTDSVLASLTEKGLLTFTEAEVQRNPYGEKTKKRDMSEIVLSLAQRAAYDTLSAMSDGGKPAAALLYGVTGSGKTKVILKLIDKVLSEGKTAVMLVPEIALTPQTVSIFCSRYGESVAVLHSSLTPGERFDAWRRIKDGEVNLVIGTRSAVFAPLDNIGLIVIDEEHEHTYKSDQNPKYHARDIAAFRAKYHNALAVFASATPAVESFYKAEKGIYTLVPLRERYGNARLPQITVVDMREELRNGNRSPIGVLLGESLRNTYEAGKQSILFLNRRGYNSVITCRICGETLTCPHCSVTLTYHRGEGGYLLCHTCGHKEYVPKACPSCGGEHLSFLGAGTEKVESELSMSFSDLKVLRMDADTAVNREAYENILDSFRKGEGDVLLGTQMVTKGHDFPNVTTAGVILADSSLRANDFRAAERTFSLLVQVVGRAGRVDAGGLAVIQTFTPEHPVIRLAAAQDYDAFYQREIAIRKSLCFPPFCDIAELLLSDSDEKALLKAAVTLKDALTGDARKHPDMPLTAFGPFEAGTYKVGNKFRMRMIVKCRLTAETRQFFASLLRTYAAAFGTSTLSIDLNPSYV